MQEFKPKKAKFGFRFSFWGANILQISHEIVRVFGYPPADRTDWWMELDTNMSNHEIRIYINNESLYGHALSELENIKQAIAV